MGHQCCSKQKVKRGLWSPEEDEKLIKYITTHGHASWSSVPKLAGLQRCGKSCRLRWINYLRPDLKRGSFTAEEERIIVDVHRILGNRWAQIAKHLPGRTDNEVKNFWNSCIKKKLISQGLDPNTHNLLSNPIYNSTNGSNYGKSSCKVRSCIRDQQPTFSTVSVSSVLGNNGSYSAITTLPPPASSVPVPVPPPPPPHASKESSCEGLLPIFSSTPSYQYHHNQSAGLGHSDCMWECDGIEATVSENEALMMHRQQQALADPPQQRENEKHKDVNFDFSGPQNMEMEASIFESYCYFDFNFKESTCGM